MGSLMGCRGRPCTCLPISASYLWDQLSTFSRLVLTRFPSPVVLWWVSRGVTRGLSRGTWLWSRFGLLALIFIFIFLAATTVTHNQFAKHFSVTAHIVKFFTALNGTLNTNSYSSQLFQPASLWLATTVVLLIPPWAAVKYYWCGTQVGNIN